MNTAESLRTVFYMLWHAQGMDEKKPVPMTPQEGVQIFGIEDPSWHIEPLLSGGATLGFRHPTQGWIAVTLSLESSRRLLYQLSQIEEQQQQREEQNGLRH